MYVGALFIVVVMIMFNGMAEINLTILKLSDFFKQRDLLFYHSLIVQTVLPSRTSTPDGIGIVQIHWRWESLAYNLDHLHRGCEEMVDLGLLDLTIDVFCEFNSCE
ncbi:hypothetical protein P3L10_026275 [Capsicum annuum]